MREPEIVQHTRPLWLAAAVTVFVTPFFGLPTGPLDQTWWNFGLPTAAFAMLVGMPVVLFLTARGWLTWVPVCLTGAVCGALAMSVFLEWLIWLDLRPVVTLSPDWGVAGLGALFGVAAGCIFCLTAGISWRRRRP